MEDLEKVLPISMKKEYLKRTRHKLRQSTCAFFHMDQRKAGMGVKQTITIMAMVMVALLVVSGFIVAGSMQQQEQLAVKIGQIADLKQQVKSLEAAGELQAAELKDVYAVLEQQNTNVASLTAANATLQADLDAAVASAEESNAALAQKELDTTASQTALTQERDALAATNATQETMIQDLGAKLTDAEKQRDEAQAAVKTLEESAAGNEELLTQASVNVANVASMQGQLTQLETENTQNAGRVEGLTKEMQAYAQALKVLGDYQNGKATAGEVRKAVQDFEKAYPSSLLTFLWVAPK